MSQNCHGSMDFERWRELAVQDPERFELLRQLMIEAVIRSASQRCQQRLRGLQWKIDKVRERSPTPMAACISLSNMMWESFAGERGLVDRLNYWHQPEGDRAMPSAKLLPFPRTRD